MVFELPIPRTLSTTPNCLSPSRTDTRTDILTENITDPDSRKYLPQPPPSPKLLSARKFSRLKLRTTIKPSLNALNIPKVLEAQLAPKPQYITVNGEQFRKHELIGKGGSAMVYKVSDSANVIFALKQVHSDGLAIELLQSFKREIDLLKCLKTNDRVVKLYNYEVTPQRITLVMEHGDYDLHNVIHLNQSSSHLVSTNYYSIELLKCVQAVHAQDIVHSDLKPANFISVKGVLKLIDFGIASPIPEFTQNVYKKEQIGTVSYMAPETLREQTGAIGFKVNKPSDLWSCGCIIYEMVYGHPPFRKYGRSQIEAILSPDLHPGYPLMSRFGQLVPMYMRKLMENLLQKDVKKRFNCDQALSALLTDEMAIDGGFILDLIKYATSLGKKNINPASDSRRRNIANAVFQQLNKLNLG